jgi:hypothetical protein
MIFSKNRYTPVGSSPEGMLFRIMLWQRERTQLRAVGGAVSKGAGLGYGQLCGAASNDRTRAGTAMCFARLMIWQAESIERNAQCFGFIGTPPGQSFSAA